MTQKSLKEVWTTRAAATSGSKPLARARLMTCKYLRMEVKMDREARSDRFMEVEDRYAGYTVYDQNYEKIGEVDDLFVDESDQPEYIGVKMGFLGTRSTLIPFQLAR